MECIKIYLILLLIFHIFCQCPDYDSEYVCSGSENTYDNYNERKFQTPQKQDSSYKSTYQDMHFLVGYPQLKYSLDRKSCQIKIITEHNPHTSGSKLLYTFGTKEQESNSLTVTSSNSYPDGMPLSVKLLDNSNREVAKLQFDNVYFLWDNPIVAQNEKYEEGQKGVIVELFGWPYEDITEECVFLGIAGYLGIKVYPPHESLLSYENVENDQLNPWNYFYQPVSYNLNSRMGNKTVLKNMINICRKNGVRVYTDTIINHMTKDGNDMYDQHKSSDCSQTWGPSSSTGGSPFWTMKGQFQRNSITDEKPSIEFPSVPYFMNHFHCKKDTSSSLTDGWVDDYIDLYTQDDYVRQRIADYFTELISIGFSGICINFGKNVDLDDYSSIFSKLKTNLGGGDFPNDLIIYLELEIDTTTTSLCNIFGTTFINQDNGLSESDKNKIKIWANDYPSNFPICNTEIDLERYVLGTDYRKDQDNTISRMGTSGSVYIKDKNKINHRNFVINTLKSSTYGDIKIRTIFSSYSYMNNGANGIPDGKSDCTKCSTNTCKSKCTKSVPYKKAYDINSKGYDAGDSTNWKEGTYTRIHRDINIVNEMRKFMDLEELSETELYGAEKEKSAQSEKCENKCSLCNENSRKKGLCLYCNTNEGYFPVMTNEYQTLYECINPSINLDGYYYDSETGTYRPCYETCKTCSEGGNPYNHNCDKCDRDLIFRPEDLPAHNCVTNCSGYYYYNVITLPQGYSRWSSEIEAVNAHGIQYNNQYKCTAYKECLKDVPYHVKDKRKCIDDCKNDDTYKYRYNSYCLSECPPNTYNDNYICKDIETDDCVLSDTEIDYLSFGNNSGVEMYAQNYAGEYTYTNNHISQYKNSKYTVTLYKNSDCITGVKGIKLELEIGYNYSFPNISFGKCYDLVKEHYGITEDLVVAFVENNALKNPYTSYSFFNPNTGEKLNASAICAEERITVYENLTALLENLPNFDLMMAMLEQGINIFDPKDPFYTDICYPYDSPVKKDISLEDRLLTFFPNVSLCDPGCEIAGLDLNNMTAICDCVFQDVSLNNEITDNALFEEVTGDIFDKLAESNIYVLKCFKYIFTYFTRSYGIYIYLVFLLVHIIMVVFYFIMELDGIMKYIFNTTQSYISFLNNNNKEKVSPPKKNVDKKNEVKSERKSKKLKRKKSKLFEDLEQNLKRNKNDEEDDKHNNSLIIFNKNNNINNINSKENFTPSVASEEQDSNKKSKKRKKFKEKNKNAKNDKIEKNKNVLSLFKSTESNDMLETIQNYQLEEDKKDDKGKKEKKVNKEKKDNKEKEDNKEKKEGEDIDFEEYLETPPEEMDYDDAIKLDKRTYCEYFADNLKGRVLFAATFCEQEPLKPITLKVMVLILSLVFYFFINGFFFNEDYISKVYHLEEDKFFDFIPRSLKRFLYALVIGEIVGYITEFFFVEESKIKGIYEREKDSILNIKNEIIETINDIKRRNLAFIIVVFILIIFFIFYVLCFNYVYHYSQIEWIKSSIVIILATQILSILLSFFETSFRYLAFKCESERLYQFSQIFN